jgi:predicted Ser/Thr protein kinase
MNLNPKTAEEGDADTLTDPATKSADRTAGIPTQVGPYRVDGIIGAGGMGVVLRGYDPALDRPVAIKIIRGTEGDEEMHKRLLREAKALAKVEHVNVVAVYAAIFEEGKLFVVMQYVEGGDLRKWLEGQHTIREIVQVFHGAGQGLAAVHEVGLVHRDFKPDNVIIDKQGQARVVDFGLARPSNDVPEASASESPSARGPGTLQSRLTQSGAFVGTPAYAAPEIYDGETADARSDQFAFCVALYEALFGPRPFEGPDFEAVMNAILQDEVVRPAGRGPDDCELPDALWAVIQRGLAKRPEDRFASMHELNEALVRSMQAVEVDEPAEAAASSEHPEMSAQARALGWARQRWIYAAFALIVVVAWAVFGTIQRRQRDWKSFEERCLQPARRGYIVGDLGVAKQAIDTPECVEVAPRSVRVESSARTLANLNVLVGGAELEPVRAGDGDDWSWGKTPDDDLAAVLVVLVEIGSRPEPERLTSLEEHRRELTKRLERARERDQTRTAAPHLYRVLEVMLRQEVELDAAVDTELANVIEEVARNAGAPGYFLVHARQRLEPDHLRAANTLEMYGKRVEPGSDLHVLLAGEQAFRLALHALEQPDDHSRVELARQAASPTARPHLLLVGARLHLARMIVDLLNGAIPSNADRAAAQKFVKTLWWDQQYVSAVERVEREITTELERRAAVSEPAVQSPPTPPDQQPPEPEPAQPPGDKPSSRKGSKDPSEEPKRISVTFFPGEFNGADFDVGGEPFKVTEPEPRQIKSTVSKIRCREAATNKWLAAYTGPLVPGLELVCTDAGVVRRE